MVFHKNKMVTLVFLWLYERSADMVPLYKFAPFGWVQGWYVWLYG